MTAVLGIGYNGDSWLDWSWVTDHSGEIQQRLREHVYLALVAVGIGLVIAFPIAILAHRRRRLLTPILIMAGVLFTIPSIAALSILQPYFGLSATTALIPLVLYTLVILVRNIVVGLDAVPSDVIDAADGMGFTGWRRLTRVELPLAVPGIASGLRIALVTTIGLVPITVIVAQGGLGVFMQDGLNRDFRTPLVVGLVLSVLLAIVADITVQIIGWCVTPWTHRRRGTVA